MELKKQHLVKLFDRNLIDTLKKADPDDLLSGEFKIILSNNANSDLNILEKFLKISGIDGSQIIESSSLFGFIVIECPSAAQILNILEEGACLSVARNTKVNTKGK